MKEFLEYKLFEAGPFSLSVGALIAVLLIYLGAHVAIAFLTRLFKRMAARRNMDQGRQYAFLMLMRYFLWIGAITMMLGALGIQITFLLASSAALLVGLGLGVQRIFSDIVAGIFLLFEGSIEQGDILQIDQYIVKIDEINLRTTVVRNQQDVVIIIPNSKFINENVINWSHENNNITQFVVPVKVAYRSDIDLVQQLLLECAGNHPEVLKKPAAKTPSVRIADFGEKGILFELLFYSKNAFEIETTKSDLRKSIWKAFDREKEKVQFITEG